MSTAATGCCLVSTEDITAAGRRPAAVLSTVETREMASVETGQMSAAETRQMSAAEIRQMVSAAIYPVSIHTVDVSEVSTAQVADKRSGPKSTKMTRNGSRMVARS